MFKRKRELFSIHSELPFANLLKRKNAAKTYREHLFLKSLYIDFTDNGNQFEGFTWKFLPIKITFMAHKQPKEAASSRFRTSSSMGQ